MADKEKELHQEAAASENAAETSASAENTAAPVKEEKPAKEKKSRKMSAAARKKFKYGGLATAVTCVVVAIVVVVNVLVSTLVEKYPVKLDLTESAMFEISDDTIEYVKGLEQEVKFTVLMDESKFQTSGTYLKMVHEILERYTQYSDKISLTYIDPTTNPDVVSQYQEYYSGTLTNGDVVVANAADPSKLRVVNVDKMFTYDDEKYYYYMYYGYYTLEDCITAFTGEQDLTSALLYVTDANPVKVGLITLANGEMIYNPGNAYSVAIFAQTLTKNGYDIAEIDLYKDNLDPAEYDMLVLPAPVQDLSEGAVEKISEFLYNGGDYEHDLIYFADISQSTTPRLDALLQTWGITVSRDVVIAEEENAQIVSVVSGGQTVQVGAPTAAVSDENYAAGMASQSLPIPAPLCRTITLEWESKTGGITSALLKTSEENVKMRPIGGEEGDEVYSEEAQTLMAVSKRRTGDTVDTLVESNIMVIGSMMLSDYYIMQDSAYNNAEYLMSAVNTMTGKGSGLIVAQKDLSKSTITIEQGQLNAVNVVIYAIPFIVVVIGIVVFVRRRNK